MITQYGKPFTKTLSTLLCGVFIAIMLIIGMSSLEETNATPAITNTGHTEHTITALAVENTSENTPENKNNSMLLGFHSTLLGFLKKLPVIFSVLLVLESIIILGYLLATVVRVKSRKPDNPYLGIIEIEVKENLRFFIRIILWTVALILEAILANYALIMFGYN